MATIMDEGTDGSPGGQDLYFHLRQRPVTPESKTLFAATGRISRVITSNPVIRRFESRLAQSSMAFANMSQSKVGAGNIETSLALCPSQERLNTDALHKCFTNQGAADNWYGFRDKSRNK